jgi:hypothetical protein
MPLQVMPQRFWFMQFWQMLKPQRHRQQNMNTCLQHWHCWGALLRRRFRREGSGASVIGLSIN